MLEWGEHKIVWLARCHHQLLIIHISTLEILFVHHQPERHHVHQQQPELKYWISSSTLSNHLESGNWCFTVGRSEHSVRAEQHSTAKWCWAAITKSFRCEKWYPWWQTGLKLNIRQKTYLTSATCQGNSPSAASSPPTIFWLPRTPHWQLPVTGGALEYLF